MSLPTVISLCCGAGLGEIGSRKFFKTILALDCWRKATWSFKANFADSPVYEGGIGDEKWIAWAKAKLGSVDGIIATPPCPGFSKHDPSDARSMVLLDVVNWVEEFRPKFVIIENVKGLLYSFHLKILQARLRRLGYETREWLIDAANVGAPQHRRRVFVIAVPKGCHIPLLPKLTHGPGKLPYQTIRDAIGDLTKEQAIAMGYDGNVSAGRLEIMAKIPPGNNYRALTGRHRKILEATLGKHRKCHDKRLCRRYGWNEVAECIQTGMQIGTRTFPFPPHVNRPFSVVEALRLMGVRQPFHLYGKVSDKYRMVGNGICPQAMEAVCKAVADALALPSTSGNRPLAESQEFLCLSMADCGRAHSLVGKKASERRHRSTGCHSMH